MSFLIVVCSVCGAIERVEYPGGVPKSPLLVDCAGCGRQFDLWKCAVDRSNETD